MPRITIVSQVVFSPLFRAHTSTHGRPLAILLPEFPRSRLGTTRRRKPHRHRTTRQVPAVSPALLPHLSRPILRTQGHPAVAPPTCPRTRSPRSSNTSTRGVASSRRRAPRQGPSRDRQPLRPAPPVIIAAPRTTSWWPTRPRPASWRWMRTGRSSPRRRRTAIRTTPRPVPGGLLGPRGVRPGAPPGRVGGPGGADGGIGPGVGHRCQGAAGWPAAGADHDRRVYGR